MLNEDIIDIVKSPWTSHALAVIGLAAAAIFYIRSHKRGLLTYQIDRAVLLSDLRQSSENIKVLYNDNPINELTSSRVYLWNEGNDAISYSDIATSDSLRLEIEIEDDPEARILDARVLDGSGRASGASIKWEKAEAAQIIPILFEFFNVREGVLIEVLHTSGTIRLRGTAKGTGLIKPLGAVKNWADRIFIWPIATSFALILIGILTGLTSEVSSFLGYEIPYIYQYVNDGTLKEILSWAVSIFALCIVLIIRFGTNVPPRLKKIAEEVRKM